MDPKALLDELMGKDRDLPLDQQKKKKLRFDDPEVCHFHLVSFCPHDLFPNTKSDLGACEKIHDDALRAEFIKSNRVSQYEAEFLGYLERLIADLERKIKRCHERLDKEMPLTEHARANSDRISAIAMEVQVLLKQAEREGEDGLVDQAQATMNKVDLLNKEKDQLVRAVMPEFGNILEKEKRMQVCEVCGAMQASTDTEKRLASHLEGKQHLGYFRIRQTADQLRKKKEEEREARRKEREVEKVDGVDQKPKLEEVPPSEDLKDKEKILNGVRPYDKERENDMRREHENRRERSRSRERAHRSHDRSRDREADRERGRDADNHREWGDKERHGDRDRDRERDRYRDRDWHRDRGERERDSYRGRERDRDRDRGGRRRSRSRERDHRR
ncbi:RNA-binding protein Luc7-like 2 [Marchantia polymorpha subsp. ruderalis]|uniref:U1-type domain-containing protein n=1 Tax=Marchantia polymorpha TaxID=3197 RepID=A0A2R6XJM8_MARPO|nr:hypothetical protein MARPO_0012s0200 [Marchantia polymorpha]BBN18632.1 hypothetical protein Mp_8g04110 [Marchantia polymorpha subsp. ruderalis]|eukprot:PTQ46279.1 hypothetical protein MARPO_0012s0200 [Marchantia polymorpha]